MDRQAFYAQMSGSDRLDYEVYLNTEDLLACQKPFASCATRTSCSFRSCIRSKNCG